MNPRRLAVATAAVAATGALAASAFAAPAARLTSSESALLARVNAVRAAHHLGPLVEDTRLESAARFHSREMLHSGVFAHGAFSRRMGRFDVRGGVAGENLAWGVGSSGSAAGVVAMWLASPVHRANLLRASFHRVGIGSLAGTFDGHADAQVVTADFAG
jgi:uncharacterized protein YkwD